MMILLDENISDEQRKKLRGWHIKVRHIGFDLNLAGIKDRQIVTALLHKNRRTLFLTRDNHFFDRELCHANYGIAFFEVEPEESAHYIRRFLKHQLFDTMNKRLGKVAKVSQTLISYYTEITGGLQQVKW